MTHKTLFEIEQQIKQRLQQSSQDAVERHALIAIIDGNDAEFTRLLNIMKKRKAYKGHLQIVKNHSNH